MFHKRPAAIACRYRYQTIVPVDWVVVSLNLQRVAPPLRAETKPDNR